MSQKLRLRGKGELIDQRGRLKVHYHDPTPNDTTYQKLMRLVDNSKLDGHTPMRHDGFLMNIKSAKMFIPNLTYDPKQLLGHNLTMICDIRKYKFEKNDQLTFGWSICPTRIEIE